MTQIKSWLLKARANNIDIIFSLVLFFGFTRPPFLPEPDGSPSFAIVVMFGVNFVKINIILSRLWLPHVNRDENF